MIGSLRSSLESSIWESGWDRSMRRSRKPRAMASLRLAAA